MSWESFLARQVFAVRWTECEPISRRGRDADPHKRLRSIAPQSQLIETATARAYCTRTVLAYCTDRNGQIRLFCGFA